MKPKMYFKTEEELAECAREWKKRLFLSDWNIQVGFANEILLDDADCCGLSEVQWENSCGVITILSEESVERIDPIEKCPHEKTIIHELLHFTFPMFEKSNQPIEQTYYTLIQHQTLERMAKSLYMAKYNLDCSWFRR